MDICYLKNAKYEVGDAVMILVMGILAGARHLRHLLGQSRDIPKLHSGLYKRYG
jgi:hypothetical protein